MGMTKERFEQILSGSFTGTTFLDGSNGYRVQHGIAVQALQYERDYLVASNCPLSAYTLNTVHHVRDSEISRIWTAFLERIHTSEHHHVFHKADTPSYNTNNGYIAVYCDDVIRVLVYDPEIIGLLDEKGFVCNSALTVPFSQEREAYYDKTLDQHSNSCGLSRPMIEA